MDHEFKEKIAERGLQIVSVISIIIILLIIGFILVEAAPAIQQVGLVNFIFGTVWNPKADQYGVFTMIISSLEMIAISLIIAIPLAVGLSLIHI